jgi:hypothetical protein
MLLQILTLELQAALSGLNRHHVSTARFTFGEFGTVPMSDAASQF